MKGHKKSVSYEVQLSDDQEPAEKRSQRSTNALESNKIHDVTREFLSHGRLPR